MRPLVALVSSTWRPGRCTSDESASITVESYMNLHTFFLDDIYRIFVSTLMDLTYSKPIRTLIFTTFISLCCCSIIVSLNLSLHLSTKIYLCMSIS